MEINKDFEIFSFLIWDFKKCFSLFSLFDRFFFSFVFEDFPFLLSSRFFPCHFFILPFFITSF